MPVATPCDSSAIGSAPAFQAGDCPFEADLSLHLTPRTAGYTPGATGKTGRQSHGSAALPGRPTLWGEKVRLPCCRRIADHARPHAG